MAPASTQTTPHERSLLDRARKGDESAFGALIEPRRGELHAHCYRMLGSVHDAEDALQDAMLRAWRAMARFEGRSSLRSWLYTIATNACLDQIAKRPKRVLPIDYAPATDPHVDAWERGDVETFAAMLTEDATFAMPPLASWYQSRDGIRIWATLRPLNGVWRWRAVRTTANGQPALGFYAWNEEQEAYVPFALNVLSFRGREISDVVAFIARSAEPKER